MKRMIHGNQYDTESSEKIGSWHNATKLDDFGHVDEILYRTAGGGYFLLCVGELTRYPEALADQHGIHNPDDLVHGELILPLSLFNAANWAAAYLKPDIAQRHFGQMAKDAEPPDRKLLFADPSFGNARRCNNHDATDEVNATK